MGLLQGIKDVGNLALMRPKEWKSLFLEHGPEGLYPLEADQAYMRDYVSKHVAAFGVEALEGREDRRAGERGKTSEAPEATGSRDLSNQGGQARGGARVRRW